MSKYRITIENIGGGADWDGQTVECDGFAILADQGENSNVLLHDVSTMDIALMIGSSEKVSQSALIGLAMYAAKRMKDRTDNPLAAILSSVRPIREDD